MPVEMYTEEEYHDRYDDGFEAGKQYVIDNMDEFLDEIGTADIDDISAYYAEHATQEWLRDAVIPNLDALDKNLLTELAEEVLSLLED